MRCTTTLLLSISILSTLSPTLQAAEWPECRSLKIRQIQLENAVKERRTIYGYRSRSAMKKEARRTDEWLWKNCRRHSKKLRKVYQDYM